MFELLPSIFLRLVLPVDGLIGGKFSRDDRLFPEYVLSRRTK